MRPERRRAGAMTRDQWRLIITGYLILTVFWLFGAGWTYHLAKQNRKLALSNQHALRGVQRNQTRIKENQGRIARTVVLNATLVCALGEGDEESDRNVIAAFAKGLKLPSAALPSICIDVQRQALDNVLGRSP